MNRRISLALIYFLVLILIKSNLYATEGEFIIKYKYTAPYDFINIKVTVSTVSTGWDWDGSNDSVGNVYVAPAFTHVHFFSGSNKEKGYDAPKSDDQTHDWVMPWVLTKFEYVPAGFDTIIFYIDFRDEGWMKNRTKYKTADIYLYMNQIDGSLELKWSDGNQDSIVTMIQNNDYVNIWDAFGGLGIPETANFTIPITLKNVVDTSNIGGTLKVNSTNYPSGVPGAISYNASDTIYNLRTNNERFINLNQSGITYKHHHWNNVATEYLINKKILFDSSNLKQNAVFQNLIPATLQSYNIDGTTLDIDFLDPWYKEQNDSQPGNWKTYTGSFTPPGAYGESTGGVFKVQYPSITDPSIQFYSIRTQSPQIKNGITYYFTGWSNNGNATLSQVGGNPPGYDQKAVVFTNDSAVITANYKAQLATGSASGYASSSQRKALRTPDGYIHVVYESAGKVWYERGVENNGNITWYLANEGQPLSGTSESKSPSLANYGNTLLVTYQEKSGASDYKIILHFFEWTTSSAKREITTVLSSYSNNTQPVVAYSPNGRVVLVWNQSSGTAGLYYYCATLESNYQLTTPSMSGMFSGTDANSSTPSIDANRTVYNASWFFPLTYTHNNTIHYRMIKFKPADGWTVENATNISSGSGFTYNFNPSIIAWGNYGSRVTWIGKRWESGGGMDKRQAGEEMGYWLYKTLFKDPQTSGTFWSYEQSVSSANIQKNIAGNGNEDSYIVAWSALYGTNNKYVRNTALTQTKAFGVNGEDVHVIGGTSFSNMYGTFLNYSGSLFKIEISSSIQTLGKQQTQPIFIGREGIVSKNNAEIFFTLGDVRVEGETIEFEPKHDTLDIDGESVLNEYLTTKPFIITNRSQFLYSIQYGFTDSAAISRELNDNSGLSFKVELIDHETNKVIGSFDEITYTANNLYQYNKTGYIVNTEGIGTKTVRLRLSVHSNIENSQYALNNAVSSESVVLLSKLHAGRKKVGYKGTLAVDDYALDQNFPNPFNPTTTISYALPQDGMVTLKIYDALGREVSTLVNEFKQSGRNTTSLNASRLSSGVYIYKLTANLRTMVKKMTLVK